MKSVIVLTEYAGPPSRLLAGYAALYRHATTRGPVRGLAQHVVGTSENGLCVVDVWDDEQAYRRYADAPDVRDAVALSGLPAPEIRVLPVFGPSTQLAELARAS
jgi:hypothetical protein